MESIYNMILYIFMVQFFPRILAYTIYNKEINEIANKKFKLK